MIIKIGLIILMAMAMAQNPPQSADPGSPPPPEGWKVDNSSKHGPLTIPFGKPTKKKAPPLHKKKIEPIAATPVP